MYRPFSPQENPLVSAKLATYVAPLLLRPEGLWHLHCSFEGVLARTFDLRGGLFSVFNRVSDVLERVAAGAFRLVHRNFPYWLYIKGSSTTEPCQKRICGKPLRLCGASSLCRLRVAPHTFVQRIPKGYSVQLIAS